MNQIETKQELRAQLALQRNAEKDRPAKSSAIAAKIMAMPQIETANVICCYVSFRSEVETHKLIQRLLELNKSVVVPWCQGDELRLTRIESINELAPRTLGLLEPAQSIRKEASRQFAPVDIEVFLVPGLAFTPAGFRPWFDFEQITPKVNILFGHWAALEGFTGKEHVHALDTGCVWGRELTMMRLVDHRLFSV